MYWRLLPKILWQMDTGKNFNRKSSKNLHFHGNTDKICCVRFLEGVSVHKQGQKGDSTDSSKHQKFEHINMDLIKQGHWHFEVT